MLWPMAKGWTPHPGVGVGGRGRVLLARGRESRWLCFWERAIPTAHDGLKGPASKAGEGSRHFISPVGGVRDTLSSVCLRGSCRSYKDSLIQGELERRRKVERSLRGRWRATTRSLCLHISWCRSGTLPGHGGDRDQGSVAGVGRCTSGCSFGPQGSGRLYISRKPLSPTLPPLALFPHRQVFFQALR